MRRAQKSPTPRKRSWSGTYSAFPNKSQTGRYTAKQGRKPVCHQKSCSPDFRGCIFDYSSVCSASVINLTPNRKPLMKLSHSFRQFSSVTASLNLPNNSISCSFMVALSAASCLSTSLASLSLSLSFLISRSNGWTLP